MAAVGRIGINDVKRKVGQGTRLVKSLIEQKNLFILASLDRPSPIFLPI